MSGTELIGDSWSVNEGARKLSFGNFRERKPSS